MPGFTLDEYRARLDSLREYLQDARIDAAVLNRNSDISLFRDTLVPKSECKLRDGGVPKQRAGYFSLFCLGLSSGMTIETSPGRT